MIFGLPQGFKDKSCPGQEIRETRTRQHSWVSSQEKVKLKINSDKYYPPLVNLSFLGMLFWDMCVKSEKLVVERGCERVWNPRFDIESREHNL